MKVPQFVSDNITDVLMKIVTFTKTRQKVLTENLNNQHLSSYIPHDLPVEEFSNLLNTALAEHTQKKRLLYIDTENIKFETHGMFSVKAIPDERAMQLLSDSRDEYVELQLNKMMENSLNQRIAMELLKQKEGIVLHDQN